MNGPKPEAILLPRESAEEFCALYQDLLRRHAADPEEPTALEHFIVQELTATCWRIRRAGEDSEAILEQVVNQASYREGRHNQLVESDERGRLRALAAREIGAMLEINRALAGAIRSITLRLLEGGRE